MTESFRVTVEADNDDATTVNVNQMFGMLWVLIQPEYDSSISIGLDSSKARRIADGLYEAARRADISLAEYCGRNS